MNPVIVCVAKKEHDYIEEFVRYHLALGFKYIYIYDNEDVPTYGKMLEKYNNNIKVIHAPIKPVQYESLRDFVQNYLFKTNITHAAHIDVDEFIVLKKHNNICDFINEYIVGDCQGIGMNWRFFGSSGNQEKTDEPNTIRFKMCEDKGNIHIKTLFKTTYFMSYNTCHDVKLSRGYIKSTNGTIINGPFNHNIDFSAIQLNHYKCKTLPEFRHIRTRGRADFKEYDENVDEQFTIYDKNEVQELTAYHFYKNIVLNMDTTSKKMLNHRPLIQIPTAKTAIKKIFKNVSC